MKPAFLISLIMDSVVRGLPQAVSICSGVKGPASQVLEPLRELPRFQPRPMSSTMSIAAVFAADTVAKLPARVLVRDMHNAAAVTALSSFFFSFMLFYSLSLLHDRIRL